MIEITFSRFFSSIQSSSRAELEYLSIYLSLRSARQDYEYSTYGCPAQPGSLLPNQGGVEYTGGTEQVKVRVQLSNNERGECGTETSTPFSGIGQVHDHSFRTCCMLCGWVKSHSYKRRLARSTGARDTPVMSHRHAGGLWTALTLKKVVKNRECVSKKVTKPLTGLEPVTLGLKVPRNSQLCYRGLGGSGVLCCIYT